MVTIETPRLGFVKRNAVGGVDFVSPFPCPWNYGSIDERISDDGDPLDALVLGPRLARGTRIETCAWGAVGFTDAGVHEDKLICSARPVGFRQRRRVLRYLRVYARCKAVLNRARGLAGPTFCEGWTDAAAAIARARPAHGSKKEG